MNILYRLQRAKAKWKEAWDSGLESLGKGVEQLIGLLAHVVAGQDHGQEALVEHGGLVVVRLREVDP